MVQNQDNFFVEFVPLHKFVKGVVVWGLTNSWNFDQMWWKFIKKETYME